MQPFNITTPDHETLYAWHVLPSQLYAENEDRLLESPLVEQKDSLAFQMLQNPNARLVISCMSSHPALSTSMIHCLEANTPALSPRQRRPRRAAPPPNAPFHSSLAIARHPHLEHRLPRLRTQHWDAVRKRARVRRHRDRELGAAHRAHSCVAHPARRTQSGHRRDSRRTRAFRADDAHAARRRRADVGFQHAACPAAHVCGAGLRAGSVAVEAVSARARGAGGEDRGSLEYD